MPTRANLKVVERSRTREKQEPTRSLPIKSVFYSEGGKQVVKKNSSAIPLNGIAASFKHLRRNTYGAWIVEIYDMRTGKLHSVMKRHVDGSIHTVFQRKHEKEGE